jgi:hypothetical protein
MRHGELETHLNHKVNEETAVAMVAVKLPPLQAARADLVEA